MAAPRSVGDTFGVAHHRLLVVLQADLVDELQLRFQPVDVILGIVEDLHEKFARNEITRGLAMGYRLLDVIVGCLLQRQVGLQHLGHGLADLQRVLRLLVGQPVQQQAARDEVVRMLHLPDGLVVDLGAQPLEAPVPGHPRMQEVLVDCGQFIGELLFSRSIVFLSPRMMCLASVWWGQYE